MRKLTSSFAATGKDGERYELQIYTNCQMTKSLSGPRGMIVGFNDLETSDGQTVTRIDKGRYEIVATGVLLLSDSPHAV